MYHTSVHVIKNNNSPLPCIKICTLVSTSSQEEVPFLQRAGLFSEYQLSILKEYLKKNQYPSSDDVEQLAAAINVQRETVRDWFVHYRCTSVIRPRKASSSEQHVVITMCRHYTFQSITLAHVTFNCTKNNPMYIYVH